MEYTDSHSQIYQEFIDKSKEIFSKTEILSEAMLALANCFQKISDLYGTIKCENMRSLFKHLSSTLIGSGENILNTGELINEYCGANHMKYHCLEFQSLVELF